MDLFSGYLSLISFKSKNGSVFFFWIKSSLKKFIQEKDLSDIDAKNKPMKSWFNRILYHFVEIVKCTDILFHCKH
jgi:hypothetical protein